MLSLFRKRAGPIQCETAGSILGPQNRSRCGILESRMPSRIDVMTYCLPRVSSPQLGLFINMAGHVQPSRSTRQQVKLHLTHGPAREHIRPFFLSLPVDAQRTTELQGRQDERPRRATTAFLIRSWKCPSRPTACDQASDGGVFGTRARLSFSRELKLPFTLGSHSLPIPALSLSKWS
jgi:hypothetical protein